MRNPRAGAIEIDLRSGGLRCERERANRVLCVQRRFSLQLDACADGRFSCIQSIFEVIEHKAANIGIRQVHGFSTSII